MPVSGRHRVHFTIPLDNRIFHVPAESYESGASLFYGTVRQTTFWENKFMVGYILPLLITGVVALLAGCEPGGITGNASSTYKSAPTPASGNGAPPPIVAAPASKPGG